MNATVLATDTKHTIEGKSARDKFLRKVLREDGWSMIARESEDWQITFRRTIKGKPGDPDAKVIVTLEDKISVVGQWGNRRSFSDCEEVEVPRPTYAHLSHESQTLATFLLAGSHILISGSSGSTNSSKHGLAFVSLEATVNKGADTVTIGSQSVYVHGRSVCLGSVGR